MEDIYFEENYGRLYEEIEIGVHEVFEFRHELGTVRHMFIKRPISKLIDGKLYYDLVTPYGYGGPLILNCQQGCEMELAELFKASFQQYCTDNNVVSEFIRFHPVMANAEHFKECYDVVHIRNTVGTNLKGYDDPAASEFSKTARKNIRQAQRAGVEFRVTVNPDNVKDFKEIYYSTMRRNHADSYYYFDDDYFTRLIQYFRKHILLVEVMYEGRVIGMGLNFVYGNLIHTHLSGTLENFHHLSPAYILQYALTVWGKENGIWLIHEGGGRTNSLDDSLYVFKKQFGKNTDFKFQIGRKIWNEEIYQILCEEMEVGGKTDFFPAYRTKVLKEYNKV
ncbi:peptidoglycan bridge formation glycyltransferase FemA/FemB family protein [Planomicrobium chinense]|uniref:GNAT family N-acetyltransferase n=1 Tax=Planococcus chinensis TaxID=272917 RepID=UPI001CC711BA|nr:GNAT family N-acetyltransferase [Planococcus chinensis]MBZ5200592.1 peptidoglycan bridge formation glycyltransferase FemA/FemB family protein [Planococcus chinensis]